MTLRTAEKLATARDLVLGSRKESPPPPHGEPTSLKQSPGCRYPAASAVILDFLAFVA